MREIKKWHRNQIPQLVGHKLHAPKTHKKI